jgi:hypothetical protein
VKSEIQSQSVSTQFQNIIGLISIESINSSQSVSFSYGLVQINNSINVDSPSQSISKYLSSDQFHTGLLTHPYVVVLFFCKTVNHEEFLCAKSSKVSASQSLSVSHHADGKLALFSSNNHSHHQNSFIDFSYKSDNQSQSESL